MEAIQNLKIDKITVWDSGAGADGRSSTAQFAASLIKSLSLIHDAAAMAGVELPGYPGRVAEGAPKEGSGGLTGAGHGRPG